MAQLSAVIDPTGANLQLNQTTGTVGYHIREGVDWGKTAIEQIVNTGAFRFDDIDGVLTAAQVTRQIALPMRIKGSSTDDLNAKLSTLNWQLARASRWQPLDLVVTPSNSTKTTTFKLIGGWVDGPYTKELEGNHLWTGTVTIVALPFGYGPTQLIGSSGSPLATATSPATFTVTPTGDPGDVPADVTVIVDSAAQLAQLAVGCVSGQTAWTFSSSVTAWSAGSGAGTRATVSQAKYSGGSAAAYTPAGSGIEQAYTHQFSASSLPSGTPIRVILTADDAHLAAAQRGLLQLRLTATSGSATQTGDWVSVPAAAGDGSTTHFLQGIDMGVFTFPPGPTGGVAYSGSTTLAIEVKDSSTILAAVRFDSLMFLPDATSIVADWPVTPLGAAAVIRVESDMLYSNAGGAPQSTAATGAHIRSRGATKYGIYCSQQAFANTTSDITYDTVSVWVELTPRYFGLAGA